MKPQAAAFLEKARAFLDKAQGLLDAHHWPDEAGRAAYLAGLHAAQALIFENTGKVIKRHSGVQWTPCKLGCTPICMPTTGNPYGLAL
jgi:uncharacterized protein (UPF0332 family)